MEAEEALSRTYKLVAGMQAHERVLARARVDPEAFESFAKHHKQILFKEYTPNIDPRDEAAVMTMLLHFFVVGVVAQRLIEGRPA